MTPPAQEPRDAAGPTVPSLTEFLLARIEAQENEAGRFHDYSCGDLDNLRFYGWQVGEPLTCDCSQPARVLSDCAARRAIVELWDETRRSAMLSGPAGGDESIIEDGALTEGLRLLASVFADHPDFDPAWRLP